MIIELVPVTAQQQDILRSLMHLYLYDFSEFTGDDVNNDGWFEDEYLPRYWSEPGRYPFFILANRKYAGFILIRDVIHPDSLHVDHHIAEFFVMRKYRRKQVGKQAAWMAFDRYKGHWLVAEVPGNIPAQQFWRNIIGEYTRNSFEEVTMPGWNGPVQSFYSQ